MSRGELYSFMGYRFRMWSEETTLFWEPVEPMPDEVRLALRRRLNEIAEHVRLNLERSRSEPPDELRL